MKIIKRMTFHFFLCLSLGVYAENIDVMIQGNHHHASFDGFRFSYKGGKLNTNLTVKSCSKDLYESFFLHIQHLIKKSDPVFTSRTSAFDISYTENQKEVFIQYNSKAGVYLRDLEGKVMVLMAQEKKQCK